MQIFLLSIGLLDHDIIGLPVGVVGFLDESGNQEFVNFINGYLSGAKLLPN